MDISDQLKSENIAKVSPTSVYIYKKEMKFEYKARKIRQFLSLNNIDERLFFSYSWLASHIDSNKIVFSDESLFCQMNDNSSITYSKKNIKK